MNNQRGFFVTGTDTMVGKSVCSAALLSACHQLGLQSVGIKPIASEAILTNDGLRNDDGMLLQKYSSIKLDYAQINPIVFEPAISPHIAANLLGYDLTVDKVISACSPVLKSHADIYIIEGAGGWLVPLNATETMADLARAFQLPIILVVAMRLGCINHSLMTYELIQQSGLPFAGWIANGIDPDMKNITENIQTITDKIGCEPWATVDRIDDQEQLITHVSQQIYDRLSVTPSQLKMLEQPVL